MRPRWPVGPCAESSGDEVLGELPGEEGPVIPVPRFRHPSIISGRDTKVIQDERGIAVFIPAEPQVHRREMS